MEKKRKSQTQSIQALFCNEMGFSSSFNNTQFSSTHFLKNKRKKKINVSIVTCGSLVLWRILSHDGLNHNRLFNSHLVSPQQDNWTEHYPMLGSYVPLEMLVGHNLCSTQALFVVSNVYLTWCVSCKLSVLHFYHQPWILFQRVFFWERFPTTITNSYVLLGVNGLREMEGYHKPISEHKRAVDSERLWQPNRCSRR